MERSIVEYFGQQQSSHCGYCKTNEPDKYSHGMWTHTLKVQDYQDLIDRGWRRSGSYTYKPAMNLTCCPQYTIRCRVSDFRPSKSQKRVLKRFHNYLAKGEKPRYFGVGDQRHSSESHEKIPKKSNINLKTEKVICDSTETDVKKLEQTMNSENTQSSSDQNVTQKDGKLRNPKPGFGIDLNLPPCRKLKILRRERRLKKLAAKGITELPMKSRKNEPQSVESRINQTLPENPAHKFEVRIVRSEPPCDVFLSTWDQCYAIYYKYQRIIHNDPPEKPSERQYRRFLCDSPLIHVSHDNSDHPGYGSFHQQYLLDGKIIAVGVIDILPNSVSSKYFFYDPDYKFLSLGTYSALRELAFVRSLMTISPDLKYYYMGFYIQNCPKMRYKGQYRGSDLLCPETYTWHAIEKCRPKLEINKYCRFDETNTEDINGTVDLPNVLVLYQRTAMPYFLYKQNKKAKDEAEVSEYARLVGKHCAGRILLFRK